jgi:urocanate hydratase
LFEAVNARADIYKPDNITLKYPSYVEDIMADIFSLGFGPFRWVCTSCDPADLRRTDQAAAEICADLSAKRADTRSGGQYKDNWLWVMQAEAHQLVVGSQARILYSDVIGRIRMAVKFNELVRSGELKSPVVISRDHHDVSGTDSPWRETCDLRALDQSQYCADMATHNFVGDALRGADWVALHNGGGTGWGNAINGGFGLVLDGSDSARQRAVTLLFWDVLNGVSRRAWAGNPNALWAIVDAMQHYAHPSLIADLQAQGVNLQLLRVTLPTLADSTLLDALFE